MHGFARTLNGAAVTAVLGALVAGMVGPVRAQGAQAGGGQPPAEAQTQKKLKDQGEYDIYNSVIKDITAQNFTKALTDLDTWKQKYPESDYRDDRLYFYIQAYNGTNQPAKVLDAASELLSKDLKTAFPDPKQQLQILYPVTFNAAKIAASGSTATPTPEELATGEKAAHQLADFAASYFTAANKPAAASDADWAKARAQVEDVAKAALVTLAMYPGTEAMKANPKDPANCAKAEPVFVKALQEYPDSATVGWAWRGRCGASRCSTPIRSPRPSMNMPAQPPSIPLWGARPTPKPFRTM